MEISREQYQAFLRMRRDLLKKNIARVAREKIVLRIPWLAFVDDDTVIGAGTIIEPFTIIHQGCCIGERCHIASFSVLAASSIGNECKIRNGAQIFYSQLGEKCEVGDIQITRSVIGNSFKAKHGRYIGDAVIGNDVNWGAGAIIANYDGLKKHRTVIEDSVFVGCNAVLIAKSPELVVGKGAVIAAGSTISKNIPPGALGIARARQENKLEWAEKKKR